MLKQIFEIKKRREENAMEAELSARLSLEQAASALQAGLQRKSDYEQWSHAERQRLYDELEERDEVKYNDLMQWNAQVADIKLGLLDIEKQVAELEHERNRKMNEYERAQKKRQDAQQRVIQFSELVNEEQRAALRQQERREESEMEDFRRPKNLY